MKTRVSALKEKTDRILISAQQTLAEAHQVLNRTQELLQGSQQFFERMYEQPLLRPVTPESIGANHDE